MQWSKSFDQIFKTKVTFCWFTFIDLLTVCNINEASAKVACNDFVTCHAAPATAKEVAFSTHISTELKAPWSLHQLRSSKWPQITTFNAAFNSFCGLLRQKENKMNSSGQKVCFDFIFAFHFVTVVVLTGFRTPLLKWIAQYSQSFLYAKWQQYNERKTLGCVKVAFRQ